MRCGCISLGNVSCDECRRTIDYLEHYLITDEPEDVALRLCLDCARGHGYVHYRPEKGGQVVTFFAE